MNCIDRDGIWFVHSIELSQCLIDEGSYREEIEVRGNNNINNNNNDITAMKNWKINDDRRLTSVIRCNRLIVEEN